MKIAFISYEYPPDTAYGGIATYVYQVSRLLCGKGHHVEVFTSSPTRCGTVVEDGILVHRIEEVDQQKFSKSIGQIFAERHIATRFDVVEGPDLLAQAQEVIRLFPDIPLVVKLHTPLFLLDKLNDADTHFLVKIRRFLGPIKRGKNPLKSLYNPQKDIEYLHAQDADEIVVLTQSMADIVLKTWKLDTRKICHIPNPYIPSKELLDIPVNTQIGAITFVGRLEGRKGVIDFAKAIPLVLRRHPEIKFRFVGRPVDSPMNGLNMQQYLEEHILKRCKQSIEFTGAVSPEEIPSILAATDICVFPSRWENFPNVCLEAMAAARGIVGSSAGGMKEMLADGKAGRLVPPRSPQKIADAVIELVENPELRMHLGQVARDRLIKEYGADRIGLLLEDCYTRAIKRRQVSAPRSKNISAVNYDFD